MSLSEKGRARGEHVLVGDQIDHCTEHQEINTWLCTSWDSLSTVEGRRLPRRASRAA